jgi:hypothetical protein
LDEILKDIVSGQAAEDHMEKVLLETLESPNLIGNSSFEFKYERDYETLCIKLQTYTNQDPKNLNVKAFYALLDHARKDHQSTKNPLHSAHHRR